MDDLQDNYSRRGKVEDAIIGLLVGRASCNGSKLATLHLVSAYGMGGSGKSVSEKSNQFRQLLDILGK